MIVTTSGATAEPKAVVHTHGAEVRHAWTMAQLYELTEDDRTFTNMPFFWVGGLTVVVLSHLHVGAAVLTVERMDATEMLDLIEKERATRLLGWTLFERISADPTFAERDLSSIVEMRPARAARYRGRGTTRSGMTETSGPHTAAARGGRTQEDLPEHLRGSFGPPVPGVQHKIVDPETGAELADGVEGEICVRGASLMDGLYKRERSEAFDDDGWYHTGDKGSSRDGLLFFTGRRTEMIKTGGANVAPREVELADRSSSRCEGRVRRRAPRRRARRARGLLGVPGTGPRAGSRMRSPTSSATSWRATRSRGPSWWCRTTTRHGCRPAR